MTSHTGRGGPARVAAALVAFAFWLLLPADALAQMSVRPHEATWLDRSMSVLGIPALIGIAWLFSRNRRAIRWRPVLWGLGLQLIFALIVLQPAVAGFAFSAVDQGVRTLIGFAEKGAEFVFQSIEPHEVSVVAPDGTVTTRFVAGTVSPGVRTIAFWVLPSIIFFSSLMTLLYHLGIMQRVVGVFARIMQRTMGTSGSESLAAAANIFVGQTEAPLLVKPYVAGMTRSELHAVMVGGFATVAGGVMAAYVSFLRHIPGIAGHLVAASILSAPAALAVAKVLVPETEPSQTRGQVRVHVERPDANAIEAIARGALDGLRLVLNVAAMLIAFVAILAMLNWALGLVNLSFEQILGWLFAPVAFVMGVPWDESAIVGRLLGEKLVLTEFLAYKHLGELLSSGQGELSERSAIIASYALCGFANFASVGIQIGGIGGIAPERQRDLAELGLLAMVGGTIAAFLTATIAGILV